MLCKLFIQLFILLINWQNEDVCLLMVLFIEKCYSVAPDLNLHCCTIMFQSVCTKEGKQCDSDQHAPV